MAARSTSSPNTSRATPGEVVYQEKVREDRLRALPMSVRRWDWQRANSPSRLAALLRPAGVPLRRAR
ncbi:hypothetical protein [Subtercola boreus]|uniref:hypothetical protein n=1 Tax=Subtercola boreus TaxID=120213 RepID=UPI001152BD3C|nr:hypothetical protein [Subtercola boreus]